jgi:3-hydroxyisobutyrate dehydrogenase
VIALLGLGEAGAAIGRGLTDDGVAVSAYDAAVHDPARAASLRDRADDAGVDLVGNVSELPERADVLLALVTGAVAVDAAKGVAPYLTHDHIYVDLNSAAPTTKQAVADVIEGVGARMVDGAVMAAVPPRRHHVPILLAGEAAPDALARLALLGFHAEVVGAGVGRASAIKLCRSLLVKGLEALLWECVAVADAYGVTDRVLAGAGDPLGGADWQQLAHYLMGRTIQHGQRRAHELAEVAEAARAVGVEPAITAAAEQRLRTVSERMAGGQLGPTETTEGIDQFVSRLREVLRP